MKNIRKWTNDGETEAWEPEYVKLGRDEDNKNMQNNKCCKDCSERKPGCHTVCSRYANLKKAWKRLKLNEEENTTNLIGIYMALTKIVRNDTIKTG